MAGRILPDPFVPTFAQHGVSRYVVLPAALENALASRTTRQSNCGKPEARWQQKLPPLFFRKQPHHETVQSDLLIPGDARDQMVSHMARLAPRPASYQQPGETHAETSRTALVFQGHQVVLSELPQAVTVEPYVRQHQEHDQRKQPAKAAEEQVGVRSVIERGYQR